MIQVQCLMYHRSSSMRGRDLSPSSRAALLALAGTLALFFWQFLTVHYNYHDNWTALFCIRPSAVPDFLKSEDLFLFEKGGGYDGMAYHLIAHDPFMRKGAADAMSDAPFRYQRILVPLLAWLAAFGQDRWIHSAYFAVILAFAYLGVFWLSLLIAHMGRSSAWGLLFLLTPATITSIDRMTVDIALAALTAGFALYVRDSPDWRILLLLVCAALTRETGATIIVGYAVYLLARKNFRGASLVASTALPAAIWFWFLSRRTPSVLPHFVNWVPLGSFFRRAFHPRPYGALPPLERTAAHVLDLVGFAGVALALLYVARLLARRTWDARTAAIYALALTTIFLGSAGVWFDAYAYGRVLTPFLLLTATASLGISPLAAFLPMILIDARLGLYFVKQISGVFHGLTGQ